MPTLKTRACQGGFAAAPPVWGTVLLPFVSACAAFLPLLVTLSRGGRAVNKPVPAVPLVKAFTVSEGSLQTQEPLGCREFTGVKTKALPDQIVWAGADSNVQGLGELRGFVKEWAILQTG